MTGSYAPPTYNVTATVKSGLNAPVEMKWATNVDAIDVVHAVAGLLAQHQTPDETLPASIRPMLLEIRIEAV